MSCSEHTMMRELDDSEELMQRVLVPIKSGSERTLGNSVIEGNVETTENTENVESSECTMKRELDDAEALVSPLFVTTKSEPDLQGTSEESKMEVNLEATQNTQDMVSGEFEMKINVANTEASIASSFAPTRAESDLEKTSGENILEDSQANKMIEVCISQASFLVKEEPIDCEETWQDHVKLEHTSPLSINIKSDGSDKSSEDGVNVKDVSVQNNWQPHLDYSPMLCSSEFVSSTRTLSAMEGTYTQKKFGGCSYSSLSKTAQLPRFGCQNELASASCFPAEETTGEEQAADAYVSKRQVEQQRAGGSRKQQSDQRQEQNCAQDEELPFQRKMLQSGSVGFKCSYCGKDFKRKCYLIKHVRIHTGERPYKCSHCGNSFTQKWDLTNHMHTHTGDRHYKCSECGKFFMRSTHLTIHMRTHTGDRPANCSQCGKSFTDSSSLTRHMRTHSGDRPYKCSQCGQSFAESGSLTKHMRTHSGDRPYKCSQCAKSFTESSSLTTHMRTHTGDRPHICAQCGKSFTNRRNLISHVRSHTGDRPFKCLQCGKSFTESGSLTRHMHVHSGFRPYKCSECGKSYTVSSSLTKHKRTHSGDRPFKCSQCCKAFIHSFNLNRHVRKCTGEQPLK